MRGITQAALLLSFLCFNFALASSPVVGVLAEPTAGNDKPALQSLGNSFVAASYVKWIEQAGARVVPLPFDLPQDQLRRTLSQINGVLFPGGGASISGNTSYAVFSRSVFAWAKQQKLPLWGTCLGFEQLMLYSSSLPAGSGSKGVLSSFEAEGLALPLTLDTQGSMLSSAPAEVLDALTQTNMTVNLHRSGVSPRDFSLDPLLNSTWRVLATNTDSQGKPFISLAEAVSLPWVASQWHPEKNGFEFDQTWDTAAIAPAVHSEQAIGASAWLSRYFVGKARLNQQHFTSASEFQNASIYNYQTTYTAKNFPGQDLWEQTYIFPKMSTVP